MFRGEGVNATAKQCCRPAHQHGPVRAVTITLLTDGRSVLDIGKHVVHFSRAEGGMVGQAYAGIALEHTALARVTELQDQLLQEVVKRRALEREIRSFKHIERQGPRQAQLPIEHPFLLEVYFQMIRFKPRKNPQVAWCLCAC